ncbi:ABC-type Mn2+/Zn2+ transport system, permease component [Spongiibacter sp. IMCC21906]|nr:ABC-type Mn2+/Zn2+ transport system, permease component [Spongiibacter sp. IMCC21906]
MAMSSAITNMTDILLNALLAGLLLAVTAGPLGSLVVWQRMAFYGDTLAHSALLGVALGVALQVDLQFSVLICCLLLAVALFALQYWRDTPLDSLLAILSHSSLAIGLVSLSLLDQQRLDLTAFLFGDLMAVMAEDVIKLAIIDAVVLLLLLRYWKSLVAITAHHELAAIEGLAVNRLRLLMMLMVATTVAIAMKIVGVLLVTAMLIIPATAAGRLARSPEQTAIIASVIGTLAVFSGLGGAWYWDLPAGPAIVCGAALLFVFAQFWPAYRRGQ